MAFEVATYADLKKVGTGVDGWNLDSDYIQTADIDASASATENPDGGGGYYGFDPLCFSGFSGTYDGQGYTISNLYINRPSEDYVALFVYINLGGIVSNLGLIDANITGGDYTAAFVSWHEGGSSVINCYTSNCAVTGSGPTGDFVGYNGGTIKDCYSRGNVSSDLDAGGFVSLNEGLIESCYSTCSVSSDSDAGGFVSWNEGTIKDCYSRGNVSGVYYVGGFCGYNDSDGVIVNCYSTGIPSDGYYLGGFIGRAVGVDINCYWDTQTSGQATSDGGEGRTTAEMTYEYDIDTYAGHDQASFPFTVDSYGEENSSYAEYLFDDYPKFSQSFTGKAGNIVSAKFYLKKYGSPTGNITAKLYSHSGTYGTTSEPNALLATSDNVDVSTLSTNYGLVTFNFTGAEQYTLVDGTKYCIVIDVSAASFPTENDYLRAGSNYYNEYPDHDGNMAFYDGSSWSFGSPEEWDMCFYVYAEGWDFTNIWRDDVNALMNDGYPILQAFEYEGSPSASISSSPSASISSSPSASISSSPSASPSTSISSSPSSSPSASISASPSSSPSPGWEGYSRGSYAAVPVDDTDLETPYSAQDYLDVDAKDGARVSQQASGEFAIHQFKDYITGDSTILEWYGRTNCPCTLSTVYLQIYNRVSMEWETVDSNSTASDGEDFTLVASIADLTNYKRGDNVICCRVYQEAI